MMRLWIAARVDREMEARLIKRGLYMVPREDGNGSEVGGVSPQVAEKFSSRPSTGGCRGMTPPEPRRSAAESVNLSEAPLGGFY